MPARKLFPGTLFRAPDGELYLIMDKNPTKIAKVSKKIEDDVKDLLNKYFRPEDPWTAAVHGNFFYASPSRPMPLPCCAAQRVELENALKAWRAKQKK